MRPLRTFALPLFVLAVSTISTIAACGGSTDTGTGASNTSSGGPTASSSGEPAPPAPRAPSKVASPNPPSNVAVPFHLLVSNQSFDLDPVDIDVYIDGMHVVTGDFQVQSQHTWIPFDFQVATGEHELRAVSKKGATEKKATFRVNATERWAVVNFWFSKQGQPVDIGIDLFDERPKFD